MYGNVTSKEEMKKVNIWIILKDNFLKFDWIIVAFALLNLILYWRVKKNADKLYNHYNKSDKLSNLPAEAVEKFKNNTKNNQRLSSEELLDLREKMNKAYAGYSNLTTMFPLFGMLGTVCALIPMVNTIGTSDTSNFFSALTSTAWGIIAAIIFKALDSTVSYKIEDNEKHIGYLLFKE